MISRLLFLSLVVASVQMPSLQAQAGPDIVVAVDREGIRQVRAAFDQAADIPDAALAVLTRDATLRLTLDSPVPPDVLRTVAEAIDAHTIRAVTLDA